MYASSLDITRLPVQASRFWGRGSDSEDDTEEDTDSETESDPSDSDSTSSSELSGCGACLSEVLQRHSEVQELRKC